MEHLMILKAKELVLFSLFIFKDVFLQLLVLLSYNASDNLQLHSHIKKKRFY